MCPRCGGMIALLCKHELTRVARAGRGLRPNSPTCSSSVIRPSASTASGSFVQTLMLTDIATGWTECAPLLVREQRLLTEVLSEMRKLLPFPLLGFDTDNDSVFMNETVRDYCASRGRVHALPALSQERPSLGGAEERVSRPPHSRLSPLRRASRLRPRWHGCTGIAAVREFLPALVQAGREGARRGKGQEALSSAGHTL